MRKENTTHVRTATPQSLRLCTQVVSHRERLKTVEMRTGLPCICSIVPIELSPSERVSHRDTLLSDDSHRASDLLLDFIYAHAWRHLLLSLRPPVLPVCPDI